MANIVERVLEHVRVEVFDRRTPAKCVKRDVQRGLASAADDRLHEHPSRQRERTLCLHRRVMSDAALREFDEVRYQFTIGGRQVRREGFLHLRQVLPQEQGLNASSLEYPRGPLHVVAECRPGVALDGGAQELHMESGVLDAGLPRPFAVSRDPIRVPRKEGVRDRLGDLLLVAPKCPRHDGAEIGRCARLSGLYSHRLFGCLEVGDAGSVGGTKSRCERTVYQGRPSRSVDSHRRRHAVFRSVRKRTRQVGNQIYCRSARIHAYG